MDTKKSQAFNFAYDAVPIMFHSQTEDFFKYLKRDGLKFLEFWWNYVGDKVDEGKRSSLKGMDYLLLDEDPKNRMILITMPPPKESDGAHFLLMQAKPEKRFAWVKLPNTRVLVLIRKGTPENPEATELGDITPRGIYVRNRTGPAPTLENMKKIAKGLAKPQPT